MTPEPRADPFDPLLDAPAAWLSAWIADPVAAARAGAAVTGAAAQFGDVAVHEALVGLRRSDRRSDTSAADPVLRAMMRAWMAAIACTTTSGTHRIGDLRGRPVIAVSNHLSYADTTATECALLRAGGAARALADRWWVLAGPKVWDEPLHAIASAALNLVPTPQSRRIGAAPSEVAGVLRALTLARARLAAGDPLLVYPEGTRSRTGRLGPFLAGVRHYLAVPGAVVLPIALSGTDRLYPVDGRRISPAAIHVSVGAPIEVDDPVRALIEAHRAVAALLPDGYRPAAGTAEVV